MTVLVAYETRPDGGYVAEGLLFDGSDCTVLRVEDEACGGPFTEYWLHEGPIVNDHGRSRWERPQGSRAEYVSLYQDLNDVEDEEPTPFRRPPRLPGFGPAALD